MNLQEEPLNNIKNMLIILSISLLISTHKSSTTWLQDPNNSKLFTKKISIKKLALCIDTPLDKCQPSSSEYCQLEIIYPEDTIQYISFIPEKENSTLYNLPKYGNSYYNNNDFTLYFEKTLKKNFLKFRSDQSVARICRKEAGDEETGMIELRLILENIGGGCLNSCSNEGVCKKKEKFDECDCLESRFGQYCQIPQSSLFLEEEYIFTEKFQFFTVEVEGEEIFIDFICPNTHNTDRKLLIYYSEDEKEVNNLSFLDLNKENPDESIDKVSKTISIKRKENKIPSSVTQINVGIKARDPKSTQNSVLKCRVMKHFQKQNEENTEDGSSSDGLVVGILIAVLIIIVLVSMCVVISEEKEENKKRNKIQSINDSRINLNQSIASEEENKPEPENNDNTQIPSSALIQNNQNYVSDIRFSESRSQNVSIDEERGKDEKESEFPSINQGILDLYFPVVQEVFLSDKDKEMSPNCAICFEDLYRKDIPKGEEKEKVRRIIMCGHLFHDKCMQTWFKEEEVCPLCKKYLDYFAIRKHEVENNKKCQELRSQCHSVTYIKDDDNQTVKIDDSKSRESNNNNGLKTIKFDSHANLGSLQAMSPTGALNSDNVKEGGNPKSCINGQCNDREIEQFTLKLNNRALSEIGGEKTDGEKNSPPNWENRGRRRVSDVSVIDIRNIPENSPEWRLEEDSMSIISDNSNIEHNGSPRKRRMLKKVTNEVEIGEIRLDQSGNKVDEIRQNRNYNPKSFLRTDSLDGYKKDKLDASPSRIRSRHISEGGVFLSRKNTVMEIIREEEENRGDGISEDSFI